MKVTISLIPDIIIVDLNKIEMNYTTTTSLAIVIILAAVALIVIIPGYLQDAKAATKTHSKSLSMSTSCNGETDEPCQTTVCEDNKPCRNLDSNSSSSQPQQTENTTASRPKQQPDSSSSDTTPFPQTPPTPQIPDYSDDEDEFD
jgi:FtsZ-interacting cell division protein ZipA